MYKYTHVVSIHRIGIQDPKKIVFTATGKYNEDGTPVMKRSSGTVLPGGFIPVEWFAEGPERMLELGAVRWPTDAEAALLAQGAGL